MDLRYKIAKYFAIPLIGMGNLLLAQYSVSGNVDITYYPEYSNTGT